MSYDPSDVTPCGLTYGEIDARKRDDIHRANEALALRRNVGARWWGYSVSHDTFDLVIGDPLAIEENIVICCTATYFVAGPISWPNQNLIVEFTSDLTERNWTFRLLDERVGFRLEAGAFHWRAGFDIHENGSLWFSADAPPRRHFEFLCTKCDSATYGYTPFCPQCGRKLPREAIMHGIGQTRPVRAPSDLLRFAYSSLRDKAGHLRDGRNSY